MPVYRTPDGKIVEEPTIKKSQRSDPDRSVTGDANKIREKGRRNRADNFDDYDIPTEDRSHRKRKIQDDLDPKTEINLSGRRQSKSQTPAPEAEHIHPDETVDDAPVNFMDDPVVGWLTVISGPGKGSFSPIGVGVNQIGRSDDLRVTVNFGDDQISRSSHAALTYDPRGRKYYLYHEGGKNLTYVNGAPVLQPTEISSGTHISMGQTIMRFIALCSDDFDWDTAASTNA